MSQHVNNAYTAVDADVSKLVISSRVYGEIAFLVPSKFVENMQKYSWCYEQSKGYVYCTDFTGVLPKTLQLTGVKVFLWKAILFWEYGRIAVSWKRSDIGNYLTTQQNSMIVWK